MHSERQDAKKSHAYDQCSSPIPSRKRSCCRWEGKARVCPDELKRRAIQPHRRVHSLRNNVSSLPFLIDRFYQAFGILFSIHPTGCFQKLSCKALDLPVHLTESPSASGNLL